MRLLGALSCLVLCTACSDSLTVEGGADDDSGDTCPAGQWPAAGGACVSVGVPPAACAAGFNPDVEGGCVPVLPGSACASGQMALPGESSCRPVGPCGQGKWGDIPVDDATVYVDASAEGVGNGSSGDPYGAIQVAVDRAPDGARIAIAAGSYVGAIVIGGAKRLTLWGRCAELVEIVGGDNPLLSALELLNGAPGIEIRDLAITGPGFGVNVTAATDVLLERVWVHDTGRTGISLRDTLGAASLTLRDSLLERTTQAGLLVESSAATVEGTVVRDVGWFDGFKASAGIYVRQGLAATVPTGPASTASVSGSLIENAFGAGIAVDGSEVLVTGTVVRNIEPIAAGLDAGKDGIGVLVVTAPKGLPGKVTLDGVYLAGNHTAAVAVSGAEAVVQRSTLRASVPAPASGGVAWGIQVQPSSDGRRPALTLLDSLLADHPGVGVFVADGDATLEGVRILRTEPLDAKLFGDGISVATFESEAATMTVTRSRVEASDRAGVASFGAHVTLSSTVLDCNAVHLNAEIQASLPGRIDDGGGNACGCGAEATVCQVLSANLAPPAAPP